MDDQSKNPDDGPLRTVGADLASRPDSDLGTDVVPDSLVSEFSSLTTPYCWVIDRKSVV